MVCLYDKMFDRLNPVGNYIKDAVSVPFDPSQTLIPSSYAEDVQNAIEQIANSSNYIRFTPGQGSEITSGTVQGAIRELETVLKSNFQAGVDAIYLACVLKGSTPASHSLEDVRQAIIDIPTGTTPTGTINITTNGDHNVTNYATAHVSGIPTLDTYEFPVGSTGTRTVVSQYNYASATNVYNKGLQDGGIGKVTINVQNTGSNTWNGSDAVSNPYSFTATVGAYYSVAIGGVRGDESTTFTGSGYTLVGHSRVSNSTYSPEDHLSGVLHGIIQATATTVSISANSVWPYTNGAISVMQIGV